LNPASFSPKSSLDLQEEEESKTAIVVFYTSVDPSVPDPHLFDLLDPDPGVNITVFILKVQ
jgi:hypothetical protein